MDPSSAPWRVVDASPADKPAGPSGPTPTPASRVAILVGAGVMVLLGVAAVIVGGGLLPAPSTGNDRGIAVGASDDLRGGEIVIDVGGAVVAPGVYRLPAGSRVGDALTAAGGFGPRVDAARASAELNLAALLEDGAHLLVPSRDDAAASFAVGDGGSGGASGGGLVELNHATQAELEALPGIGPVTATKIIAAREETPFTSVDDLRTRKLLGQKTFDGLRDLVTVR